jgi:DNA (cytosine-5)-methyltransferase 1
MKFISLFAGIGGLDLGLERAGMECVAQVEKDDFCQKVLTKHWANVPKFKDVCDVGKDNLPPADLICGGFPCQDVSFAGKRKGLEGKRSTLWSEFHRIICEIQPRWIIIENVPGLLSSDNGEFCRKIFRELSASRYHAEWDVVSANQLGAQHLRRRLFIVAYADSIRQSFETEYSTKSNIIFPSQVSSLEWLAICNQSNGSSGNGYQVTNHFTRTFEPCVCGAIDGIPRRMDRIRGLGNAVVPQVAEFVGYHVMKAETCLTPREPDKGDSSPLAALSNPEASTAFGVSS